jgi:threonine dehydrogenase-like Zn-dependent dehydrogenase
MKAACFQSVENVTCDDKADPAIQDSRDAIVRVTMAGLCGSDLHPFFGREKGLDVGTVMGHELVGEIVELGADAKANSELEIGDQVFAPFSTHCGACYYCKSGLTSRCVDGQLFGWVENGGGLEGCQSEYARIPMADATAMKLPNGVSSEAALLLGDNFSTGYYCAEMAEVKPGGVYVVIGCGNVGQMCILAAISMKADKVFALDPVSSRRKQAESHGAIALPPDDAAIREVLNATGGRGADAVMELVGLPKAQELAFQCIRPGGIMSVIGCHCTPNFSFSPSDAYDRNLTYRTGRCPAGHYMRELSERVASGEFDLDSFITHRFEINEAEKAYDVFSKHSDGCLKAVFQFS